jgi:hypothetical protein
MSELNQWVVMVGAQCVVYPTQDGVPIITSKPTFGGIEQATRFDRRRARVIALKTSAVAGLPARAVLVRDALIINHETP